MQAPRKRNIMIKDLLVKRDLMLPIHSRKLLDFGLSAAEGLGGRIG